MTDVKLEETTGGCTLVMRIEVYRTSIPQPRSRLSVWFVERINVSPVFVCAGVRGQHLSSSAIRYYSILVKDQTHMYEIPFSARAGCIEQDHRISCQEDRSVDGHFQQILGCKAILDKITNFAS